MNTSDWTVNQDDLVALTFLRRFFAANPTETAARLELSNKAEFPGGVGLKPILRK
jgi:hypothetical protein